MGGIQKSYRHDGQQFSRTGFFRSSVQRAPIAAKCREANAVRRVAETQDQKLRFPHRRVGKESCDPASALPRPSAAAAEQCSSRWNQVKCRKAGIPARTGRQTGLLREKSQTAIAVSLYPAAFHLPSDFSLLHHFSPAAHFSLSSFAVSEAFPIVFKNIPSPHTP